VLLGATKNLRKLGGWVFVLGKKLLWAAFKKPFLLCELDGRLFF